MTLENLEYIKNHAKEFVDDNFVRPVPELLEELEKCYAILRVCRKNCVTKSKKLADMCAEVLKE